MNSPVRKYASPAETPALRLEVMYTAHTHKHNLASSTEYLP